VKALCRHAWPGNVRELENAIEQALSSPRESSSWRATCRRSFMAQERSPRPARAPCRCPTATDRCRHLEELERQLIERAYQKAGGVKTETARLLAFKTSALYYKLEKYGFLQKGEPPEES